METKNLSLYQKYRPLDFDTIVGHESVVKDLKGRCAAKNLPQALLFIGESGTGKTTLGRILAMAAKCTNLHPDGNPCGQCTNCRDIVTETYNLDNYFFNAADMGIDDFRKLEETVSVRSILSRKKVIFIDEFQRLSPNSKGHDFFLTLLERKRPDILFIMSTMDDTNLSKAIRNRAVPYYLKKVPGPSVRLYLQYILDNEIGYKPEHEHALDAISTFCDGSVRTAVSMLERCLFSDLWTEEEIVKELGIVTEESLKNLIGNMLTGNPKIFNTPFIRLETCNEIRNQVYNIFMAKHGIEVWDKRYLGLANSPKISKEAVSYALAKIYDMIGKYNYVSTDIYTYTLLNIAMDIEKGIHLSQPTLPASVPQASAPQVNPPQASDKPLRRRISG